ncbi:hypothetical protein Gogos_004993, partial [Gossypium gossypioides]|nr:hypothetical protein [Gossypium gossypioides]
ELDFRDVRVEGDALTVIKKLLLEVWGHNYDFSTYVEVRKSKQKELREGKKIEEDEISEKKEHKIIVYFHNCLTLHANWFIKGG